jgi:hemolysin activation/secretion protein
MRDLDNSLEDLKIVPQLNLTINVPPSQADVKDYGILVTSSGLQVPLNPICE